MRKRDEKKLNNDDLAELKSLIGDAEAGSFSLDDILAEYGSGRDTGRGAVPLDRQAGSPDLPWPKPPRRTKPRVQDKVVAFPAAPPLRLRRRPSPAKSRTTPLSRQRPRLFPPPPPTLPRIRPPIRKLRRR